MDATSTEWSHIQMETNQVLNNAIVYTLELTILDPYDTEQYKGVAKWLSLSHSFHFFTC